MKAYSKSFQQVINDTLTNRQINAFSNGVISLNKRLDRIKELREKFGFVQHDNRAEYLKKSAEYKNRLTAQQKTAQSLARLNNTVSLVRNACGVV